MIDDMEFARTIALVFRKLILLQMTVQAQGRAMRDRDPEFERAYDAHRAAMLVRATPLIEAIDQLEARGDAADLLELLKSFNLRMQ